MSEAEDASIPAQLQFQVPASPTDAKDNDFHKDNFRILVTGFSPLGQHDVNPSWLAAKPLHNVVLQTDPVNHPRVPPAEDKPCPPLDEKLLIPRSIHISTLEIPATYQAVVDIVPSLHLRPPIPPPNVGEDFLKPPENGYDFMFHIGLAGRGPLRLERVGHKLGYNMKDASGQYAPVVIPQPKDFSRRAPDGQPMTIAEKAERERLGMVPAPDHHQGNPVGDSNAKPNRGFGGPSYELFSDEINTDLDVTRIVQDLRQTGVEALQTIYSSMDGGHFLGDFLYYCSLAESKRSANPYEKRRNCQVLFLHCAPVGFPLDSEVVTDAIKRIILWVCNEIQTMNTDDTPNLPPAGRKIMPIRFQQQQQQPANSGPPTETVVPPPVAQPPPPVQPTPPPSGYLYPPSSESSIPTPPLGYIYPPPPVRPLVPPPPVQPPPPSGSPV